MKKVLIIDDKQSHADFTGSVLAKAGFAVTIALSCERGLDVARDLCPDIILCDINFPAMGGLEFATLAKKDDRIKGITLIAVSAHAYDGDKTKAEQAGFDGYLTKPIDPRIFANQVLSLVK